MDKTEPIEYLILHHDPAPAVLLVQPVDEHDMQGMDSLIGYIRGNCGVPFVLAAVPVEDWNRDLSPWEAPAVFGDQAFGSGAAKTLECIENIVIPGVLEELGLPEDMPVVLGGYSLAGFFSLWASYRTERFAGVCAASPSVWFPGWMDYARQHAPLAGCVYLSLGDREVKTRNRTMAAVGECIREQYRLLGGPEAQNVVLEWNQGNHFKEPDIRTAKGFVWCVERVCK